MRLWISRKQVDGGKEKKQLEEVAKFGSTDTIIDPLSPISRHVKWKMVCIKKTSQMTFKAKKKIVDKIVSHFQLSIAIIYVYYLIE